MVSPYWRTVFDHASVGRIPCPEGFVRRSKTGLSDLKSGKMHRLDSPLDESARPGVAKNPDVALFSYCRPLCAPRFLVLSFVNEKHT
jgi:hypothetical protein